jgi:hypothetical protein
MCCLFHFAWATQIYLLESEAECIGFNHFFFPDICQMAVKLKTSSKSLTACSLGPCWDRFELGMSSALEPGHNDDSTKNSPLYR